MGFPASYHNIFLIVLKNQIDFPFQHKEVPLSRRASVGPHRHCCQNPSSGRGPSPHNGNRFGWENNLLNNPVARVRAPTMATE